MRLYPDKVYGFSHLFAKQLKIHPVRVAQGVIDIVNTHMERAIKVISVEKGFDVRGITHWFLLVVPAGFTLVR